MFELFIIGLLLLPALIYFTARSAAYEGTYKALEDYQIQKDNKDKGN